MQLLVSVQSGEEAAAALAGGADIIDAKDPRNGPLGAVSLEVLTAIAAAVRGRRPITAALGDAEAEAALERHAAAFAACGAALVKVGFAGVSSRTRVEALTRAAVRGTGAGRVIAVAYADHARVDAAPPDAVIAAAADAGAAGILVDTADKSGPGLLDILQPEALEALVHQARRRHLLVAMAGRLTLADLGIVGRAGPDIAGVRGAACEGGRAGGVSVARVRALRDALTGRPDLRTSRQPCRP